MKVRGEKNPITKGVNKAVDYCIENNILADFLKERKAEVISMTITEWNEEEVLRKIAEENKEEGYNEGFEAGEKIGEKRGLERGEKRGEKRGLERGEFIATAGFYEEGLINLDVALEKLNMTEEIFLQKLEEYKIAKML